MESLDDDWEADWERAASIPGDALAGRLEEGHFDILTYDDAVIAVAFAQLVLEGNTSRDIAALAARALERQAQPEVIAFRGWSDPDERGRRCAQMLQVVQSAT